MSTRLSKRNARLVRSYPILEKVPENERLKLYRKAVMHPVVLLIVVGLGIFVLPYVLEYLIVMLDVPAEASDAVSLIKIVGLLAIPFCFVFFLLKKVLLPLTLRLVIQKAGYLDTDK